MEERREGGEETESYRVTDKRRVGREGSSDAARESETAGAVDSDASGGEPGAGPAEEARVVTLQDLVRFFIAELHARAWVHMGLVVDPVTKQLGKDLPQAQLAIDCVASLIERLTPFLEHAERDHLEGMLADLRINYVRQSRA